MTAWPITQLVLTESQKNAAIAFESEDGILEPMQLASGNEWCLPPEVKDDPVFASLTWLQTLPTRGIYPNDIDFPGHTPGEYFMVPQEAVVAGDPEM